RTGEYFAVAATPPGPVFHLVGSLAYGLGWPTLLLSLLAVGLALTRRRRRDWLLLSFLVLWYASISLPQVRYMRYAIPLLPILALLVGRLLDELRKRASEPALPAKRALLAIVRIAAVAALCHALLYTWAYDDAMAGLAGDGGPRAECLPAAGAEAGDSVGTIWPPWFCHPPVEYVNGGHILGHHRVWRRFRRSPYDVRRIGFDLDAAEQLPSFFITTSFEVRYHQRLGTREWRNLQETLWTHYVGEVLYQPAARLGHLPGADMHEAPADWLYPFPEIAVYRLDPDASPGRAEATEGSDESRVEGTDAGS
ncbi:MAG: hypothetical protein ACE5JM_12205, partial [Armatimonadota bacterium]